LRDSSSPSGTGRVFSCGDELSSQAPGLHTAAGQQRLFDLFRGTHFTLLAFGQNWDEAIEAAGRRFGSGLRSFVIGEPGSTVPAPDLAASWATDTEGHARRGYHIQRDTLLMVRPDGHIGLATENRSAEPVLAYLGRCASPDR